MCEGQDGSGGPQTDFEDYETKKVGCRGVDYDLIYNDVCGKG